MYAVVKAFVHVKLMHGQCSQMDINVGKLSYTQATQSVVGFICWERLGVWTLSICREHLEATGSWRGRKQARVKQRSQWPGRFALRGRNFVVELRQRHGQKSNQLFAAMVANRSLHWCRWRSARPRMRLPSTSSTRAAAAAACTFPLREAANACACNCPTYACVYHICALHGPKVPCCCRLHTHRYRAPRT